MIIYSIKNKITGQHYIGQTTKELRKRIWGHRAKCNSGTDFKLYRAIREYGGWDNFEIEILATVSSPEDLDKMEQFYIAKYDSYKNGYNENLGGDDNAMNSPEVKEKHDNIMRSADVRNRISKTMKTLRAEKGFSEETRKRISAGILKAKAEGRWKPNIYIMTDADRAKAIENRKKKVSVLDINTNLVIEFDSFKQAATWGYSIGIFNSVKSGQHFITKHTKSGLPYCEYKFIYRV